MMAQHSVRLEEGTVGNLRYLLINLTGQKISINSPERERKREIDRERGERDRERERRAE